MFIKFNQNGTCFYVVSPEHGLKIYSTSKTNLLCNLSSGSLFKGIEMAEMLYQSNLIALVGGKFHSRYQANQLSLYDCSKKEELLLYNFESDIERIQLDFNLLMITNKTKIFVFNNDPVPNCIPVVTLAKRLSFNDTRLKKLESDMKIYRDGDVPAILKIAYFGSQEGHVRVYSCPLTKNGFGGESLIIRAHDSALAAVCFSNRGELIATASTNGTVIRVFNASTGQLVCEFRRGLQRARIFDLKFSFDDKVLLVSSSTKTVHFFRMPELGDSDNYNDLVIISDEDLRPPEIHEQQPSESAGSGIKTLMSDYLQRSLPRNMQLEHSFAQLKVPTSLNYFATSFIKPDKNVESILLFMVLSEDLQVIKYELNMKNFTIRSLTSAFV